jgi:uncharacterized protein YukE
MTDYAHHPDFRLDVEDKLTEFAERLNEGLEWVSAQWDKCVLDSNWGWLSPGLKAAYEVAKNSCESKMEELVHTFETEARKIWEEVDNVTGDPFELMAMNDSYIRAAGALRDEKIVMERLRSSVGARWEGEAYDAYADMIGEQVNAISGLDAGIVSAATACAEGAKQINDIWNDIVAAILAYAGTIVDAIKEGTDAGQWVTLDTGPALKVILGAVLAVADLALDLERYWAENATVQTSMWRVLNSGLDGLDANNDWPRIKYYTDSMDDKGGWDAR